MSRSNSTLDRHEVDRMYSEYGSFLQTLAQVLHRSLLERRMLAATELLRTAGQIESRKQAQQAKSIGIALFRIEQDATKYLYDSFSQPSLSENSD